VRLALHPENLNFPIEKTALFVTGSAVFIWLSLVNSVPPLYKASP
jgi:hypothetical protein